MSQTQSLNPSDFENEVLNFPGLVLVDFYADWCGPCKQLAPELDKLATDLAERQTIKIAKLDIEQAPELAQKYQVQAIPNVVLFDHGKVVDRQTGLANRDHYKRMILNAMLSSRPS